MFRHYTHFHEAKINVRHAEGRGQMPEAESDARCRGQNFGLEASLSSRTGCDCVVDRAYALNHAVNRVTPSVATVGETIATGRGNRHHSSAAQRSH